MPQNQSRARSRRIILASAIQDIGLQPLERRVMFTSTPDTVLTLSMRKELLADWNGPNKAQLTADLAGHHNTQFDNDLLSYMQSRTNATFYFTPSQISDDLSYIQTYIGTSDITNSANDAVNHLFPASPGAGSDTLQLPAGDINWLGTTQGDTSKYQSLNRQAWWQNLATAYRLTGNTNYSTELTNELASWSAQNPALVDANTWSQHAPSWSLLDTSIRAVNWTWAYSLMIGTSGWTAEANTLFLVKMAETGQFLDAATPYALNDNRAIEQYQGLDYIATLFPEFTSASTWNTFAHKELFSAMNQQIYPDGSDREQAPGYAGVVLNNLLDTKLLDQDNGYNWNSTQSDLLTTGVTAYMQMLSPNGDRAA
ncbi:MAG: hypothetical protein JO353_00400, partial [Phycisphaerae bacterium]|nr:hypothetical protein [Phycisphaerae bacterium]